jgi:hypothetical protein
MMQIECPRPQRPRTTHCSRPASACLSSRTWQLFADASRRLNSGVRHLHLEHLIVDKRLIFVILMLLALIYFKFVALLLALLVALALLLLGWYMLRRQYWLRVRGFWAVGKFHAIEYEERHGGKIERLIIPGESMARGRNLVYAPSREQWDTKMPAWARGRRNEVLAKARICLGTKNYEFIWR